MVLCFPHSLSRITNPELLPQSQLPWPYGRQRHCNFTDFDPFVPVHTFDHKTTSTPSVCLFAAVPKSSYRLPIFCVVSFLNCDLSLPFRAQVRQVVGLLIVLSKNVL